MNDIKDQLVFSLFRKQSLSECSREEIREICDRYPFWATAQWLLAEKMKETADPDYLKQVGRTSLYFHNPLWLDLVLQEKKEDYAATETGISFEPREIPEEEYYNDEIVVENKNIFLADPANRLVAEKEILPEDTIEKTTGPPEKDTLVFEPFHTVDYFASQGIKPEQIEKPADRFGQQLKSFTEWLKTLKKLPTQATPQTEDPVSEEKVIHLAEHSIDEPEVDTEAMAEVWIKQGQSGRAIEIYSKLSLLNPSKSSYFAGLIEKLKHS